MRRQNKGAALDPPKANGLWNLAFYQCIGVTEFVTPCGSGIARRPFPKTQPLRRSTPSMDLPDPPGENAVETTAWCLRLRTNPDGMNTHRLVLA